MPRLAPSLVFNELSIRKFALDRNQMLEWMNGLVAVLKEAYDRGIETFRTDKDFRATVLLVDVGYTIQDWCRDKGHDINEEARGFLLDYFTLYNHVKPHVDDLPEEHQIRRRLAQGFISDYDGMEAVGLGFAHLLKHVAVSFACDDWKDIDYVPLECIENVEDTLVDATVKVKHAATIIYLDMHHPKRAYKHNPKHPINAHEEAFISGMDLKKDEALRALAEGIQPDGMDEFYSYYKGGFYVFRPHISGEYHGYRVQAFDTRHKADILKKMRDEEIITQAEYQRYIR